MKLKTNICSACGGNGIVLSLLIYNIISHYRVASYWANLLTPLTACLCTFVSLLVYVLIHECVNRFYVINIVSIIRLYSDVCSVAAQRHKKKPCDLCDYRVRQRTVANSHSQPVITTPPLKYRLLTLSFHCCLLPSITSTSMHFQVTLSRLCAQSRSQLRSSIRTNSILPSHQRSLQGEREWCTIWPAVRRQCQHHSKNEKRGQIRANKDEEEEEEE